MRKIILLLYFLTPLFLYSQNCPNYDNWLKKGKLALEKDPAKAFTFFRNAQIEAKLCKIKSTAADDGISKAFTNLEALKRKAEDAEKRANENAGKAQLEKTIAEKARDSFQKMKTVVVNWVSANPSLIKNKAQEQEFSGVGINVRSYIKSTVNLEALEGATASKDSSSATPRPMQTGASYNDSSSTLLQSMQTGASYADKNLTSTLGFYLRTKKILDSLTLLHQQPNRITTNTQDDEAAIEALLQRLDQDIDNNIVAKHLYDSAWKELRTMSSHAPGYDFLVYTYLRAALYYSWNLTSGKKFELAKQVLDQSHEYIESFKKRSAIIYSGIAGLKNSCFNYYTDQGMYKEAYACIRQAIESGVNAIAMNPHNAFYQRGLSGLLRNATFVPDSILSKEDKLAIQRLGCACADNIELYFPKRGISIDAITTCTVDEANDYISKENYQEAILALKKTNVKLDAYIKENKDKKLHYFLKSKLSAEISSIYTNNLKDSVLSRIYLDSSIRYISLTFENQKGPLTSFTVLKPVFDKMTDIVLTFRSLSSKKDYFENLVRVTKNIPTEYGASKSISYMACISYMYLGETHELYKTKADSLIALKYFDTSIALFEKTNVLSDYNDFSEDIAKFCKAYSEFIKINLADKNYALAEQTYNRMITLFKNYYKKFDFDFYFISNLKSASVAYGDYLYTTQQYEKALPVLELASYEGHLASSEKLANIFGNASYGFADTAKLGLISRRMKYQSNTMKKFTIPTQFGQQRVPFDVYVIDRDPLYPYPAIEDQVRWIANARGGVIPKEVREAFIKLQVLAWKNDVSFAELSAYALEAANKEKIIKKYEPFKDSIAQLTDETQKRRIYENLYTMYEDDIETSTDKEDITKMAVEFYNEYANYLAINNQPKAATPVIRRILELDPGNMDAKTTQYRLKFNEIKNEVEKLTQSNNIQELLAYLSFSLQLENIQDAKLITEKILSVTGGPKTREEISTIYQTNTSDPNFEYLFLMNKEKIKEYRDYFLQKSMADLPTNNLKQQHYLSLIKLDQAYLEVDSSEKIKKQFSTHCNSYVWYSILTRKLDNSLFYLEKSVQYDPASLYPYSNIPHIYLFKKEFEKAKQLYLQYKDLPFEKDTEYPTFKDAFLADFKDFENAGLMNDNIKEIMRLLNQK